MKNMSQGWFVTGTDTGAGKTHVACALMRALALCGRSVVGMKPVASGCRATGAGLRSDDAEALQAQSSIVAEYDDINPYAFAPATAPHLAAASAGVEIRIDEILSRHASLSRRAQCVVVEGVGGWLVPIGPQLTMADVAKTLELPAIMVVGIRLGALNHALLTARAISASGVRLAAWVANHVGQDVALEGYVEALRERLDAPLLGSIPYRPQTAASGIEQYLDLPRLLL